MEEWAPIKGFPGYEVSSHGRVFNVERDRPMALLRNQHGVVNVGLTRGKVQHKRSVAVLVARAFVPRRAHPSYNTPIHLDGDRTNCRADNLMWRPLWFAREYHRQILGGHRFDTGPIREIHTKEIYDSAWHAATSLGLLERDIAYCLPTRTIVWPGMHIFEEVI
ncbi:MAG: NUMOD4 domain-containing protein [bacterium]